ncbi:Arylsulfatase J [Hypsibius exemplaris]|uniref:Arylsulfatase J n=1 Tax=Hypsibius exemplaris TaxID=2072580 RepID=A0A9X6NF82_HYPEX|nr:Arylsulfatase J [Hypsibius exemplaris]
MASILSRRVSMWRPVLWICLIVLQLHRACAEDIEAFSFQEPRQQQRPNIIVIIADDLGRTDISFTESNRHTPTPNIDRLAWNGIILNRHYSYQFCTPTRAAFMTGKYSIHTGMQGPSPIGSGEPWGLPLQFQTQGNLFKRLGYQTWNVGKWHLGESTRAHYPERRGFDYFYGILAGESNWFNYTVGWITPIPNTGKVLRENGKAVFENITNNVYFPDLITSKAEQLIRNSDPNQPFYLLYTTPVPHSAIDRYSSALHTMPQFQLRPSVFRFSSAFPKRKRQLGLIQVLDENVKRLTDALINKGVANNSIIVFFSDNGAAISKPGATRQNYGVNWPLRSGKGNLFEGGVRTVACLWSPLLKRRGWISNKLFHLTDWLPTLWEAAGGDPRNLPDGGDGFSHWRFLQSGAEGSSPRRELLLDVNSGNYYGIIVEDQYGTMFKLLGGKGIPKSSLDFVQPEGTTAGDMSWRGYSPAAVKCNFREGVEVTPCVPEVADCLFDLTHDPCELNNIAARYPATVQFLQQRIQSYNATALPSVSKPFDPQSNPNLWDGWWVPWKDPVGEIYDTDPLEFAPLSPSTAT